MDYSNPEAVWDVIPHGWWLTLMSATCKFMLACLVYKDNKDISCRSTKLPPGRSCKDAPKEKARAIVDDQAKAKLDCPVAAQE